MSLNIQTRVEQATSRSPQFSRSHRNSTLLASLVSFFFALVVVFITSGDAFAQNKFRESYPARSNVRLVLKNRNGTIEVIGWNKNQIDVVATRESPAANFQPRLTDDRLEINVMRDTDGREVGDVNFTIHVPFNAAVDLETVRGGITVSGLQGAFVLAQVTEGDIELTNIRSNDVNAESRMGNILFDGVLAAGGNYWFQCTQGDITVRLPGNSSFAFNGTARQIEMGPFAGMGQFATSERRRVIGKVKDGSASFGVRNMRGGVTLISR